MLPISNETFQLDLSSVKKLSKLTLLDTDFDIKGDAFEYFLKNSVSVGNDLGEYFTPRHIVKLIVDLVDPRYGETVYDPTCGTGGFLIQAFRHIKSKVRETPARLKILSTKCNIEYAYYVNQIPEHRTGVIKIKSLRSVFL